MMTDLHNNIEIRRLISPQRGTGNSALVSQIIDLANVTQCELVVATGTLADTNATFAILVEDGDDSALTDNAAVDDAFLLGTESGAAFAAADDDDVVRKIGYIGPKRYVRLTITPSGNDSGNHDISAVAILAGHRVLPKSSQSA